MAGEAAKIYNAQAPEDTISEVALTRNINYHKRAAIKSETQLRSIAVERIIGGTDESVVITTDAAAMMHGRPVGRLCEVSRKIEPKGFATGFLAAPNILITNNHVFGKASEAQNCLVNFFYETNEKDGSINKGISFALKPDVFFYTFEKLDFSLVYVEELDLTGTNRLSSIHFLPLIETKGKVKLKSKLNIIQHPGGGVKKYAMDENVITGIDEPSGTLFYSTDTQKGSSGSPCFNQFWEVAGLHNTSVPRMDSDGNWLTENGQIWNEEMDDDDVDWIANAGKSISKIIEHLSSTPVEAKQKQFINLVLQRSKDPLKNQLEDLKSTIPKENQNIVQNITMNFHGPTTVYVNAPAAQEATKTTLPEVRIDASPLEKKERFDENYSNRKGYDPDFIADFHVPVPTVISAFDNQLYKKAGTNVPYIVKYHHYSLVMNKERRMLMWAASNVDYNPKLRDNRTREQFGNGAWRLDPRIPAEFQIQASEFYDPATLVDKGHIVRRDDNCWANLRPDGSSDSDGIEFSNADTFHWTNCTPQHEAFNRDIHKYSGIGLWGVLENAIKEQLDYNENSAENANKDYGRKACVIAGPIFRDDDPVYLGIKYPLRFFKVFAIRSKSEGNLVYGFILSQKNKVDEFGIEQEGLPRFEKKVEALQVNLREIERQSGLLFDRVLHDADVKKDDDTQEDILTVS